MVNFWPVIRGRIKRTVDRKLAERLTEREISISPKNLKYVPLNIQVEELEKMLKEEGSSLSQKERDDIYFKLGDVFMDAYMNGYSLEPGQREPLYFGSKKVFLKAAEAYASGGYTELARGLITKYDISHAKNVRQTVLESLPKRAGETLDFIERQEKIREKMHKKKGEFLENKVAVSMLGLSVITLALALFFLPTKIIGNIIGISENMSNYVGIGLLVVGIICMVIWLNLKRS